MREGWRWKGGVGGCDGAVWRGPTLVADEVQRVAGLAPHNAQAQL